jgi:outer membrane protein TolC
MSKKQIASAAMGYSPTLTIGYRYSDVKYFTKEEGMRMRMTPPNVFTVGVSMPLFTSGRVFEKITEGRINHKQNLNRIADLEDNLKLQDKQLKFNLNSAYENYIIQKKNIEVTNRVFNNVSEKFHYGKASALEVNMASTDFISAQNSFIQALMDVTNAQIALINLLNK